MFHDISLHFPGLRTSPTFYVEARVKQEQRKRGKKRAKEKRKSAFWICNSTHTHAHTCKTLWKKDIKRGALTYEIARMTFRVPFAISRIQMTLFVLIRKKKEKKQRMNRVFFANRKKAVRRWWNDTIALRWTACRVLRPAMYCSSERQVTPGLPDCGLPLVLHPSAITFRSADPTILPLSLARYARRFATCAVRGHHPPPEIPFVHLHKSMNDLQLDSNHICTEKIFILILFSYISWQISVILLKKNAVCINIFLYILLKHNIFLHFLKKIID